MSEDIANMLLVLNGLERRISILESKKYKKNMLYDMYLIDLKFLHKYITSLMTSSDLPEMPDNTCMVV